MLQSVAKRHNCINGSLITFPDGCCLVAGTEFQDGHVPQLFDKGMQHILSFQYFVIKDNVDKFLPRPALPTHVIVCLVHRDILSELSYHDIAKEFVRSNEAR